MALARSWVVAVSTSWLVLFVGLPVSAAPPAPPPIPKIVFLYPPPEGSIFDRTVPRLMNAPLDTAWVKEAVRRVPEFQALWDREGPAYLRTAFAAIGLEFPYHEMQAVLTVSQVGTMSMPLLINVAPYLAAAQPRVTVHVPFEDFPETVFHELMHHYTKPVFARSALRKRYAAEAPAVTSHLHVMALEKLVLLTLGRTEALERLDRLYRNDPPPGSYRRAWEIVNDIEGYEAFVDELKETARAIGKP